MTIIVDIQPYITLVLYLNIVYAYLASELDQL